MDTPAASTFGGRLVSGGVYEGYTATLPCTLAACLSAGAAREQGLSEVTTSGWYGFMAPGATPQSIVDRMQAKVIRVLAYTEVKQTPLVYGLEVNGGVAAEAGKFINEETRKWGGVIRAAGHERNKGDEE